MKRMLNFIEWCQQNNLRLEAMQAAPVRRGTKVPDPNKYSGGKVRKACDDLTDYKGHWAKNGTVDPFKVTPGKGAKPAASTT